MGRTEMNASKKPVCVVIGATSKWQADGRQTHLIHGQGVPDDHLPVGVRWDVGGALALKFAAEGYFTVVTTRTAANAAKLEEAIKDQGADGMTVELDLSSENSVKAAFAKIRAEAGDPEVLIYNAGYNDGRELPDGMDLLEYIPTDLFDRTQHVACRGPFMVAKEVLPAMRKAGKGSFLISNNNWSLRGKKRKNGDSLYYPRVMMRTLAQVLTEEYSPLGVHVANVVIDGLIDSPGTRVMKRAQDNPDQVINPVAIANAFWYLHIQDRTVWSHELQLTPHPSPVSY
jgi:NAD(P)-dependent dehydrogenase (short-subunit alcohol dehydrogenase family)